MSNPFIKNKKIFLIYLLIWIAIGLIHSSILFFMLDQEIEKVFLESLIYNFLYLLLGISLWYTVSYNTLEVYSTTKIFLNHAAAAIITSGFWIFIGYYLLSKVFESDLAYKTFLFNSLALRFMIGIFFYSVIVAVDYVIIYYTNFQQKLFREAELNALVKEAELKSLKYQINPHFIFNSLNSISSLTLSDPAKAQDMTIKLSSFLRSTLSKNEKQKSKLSEEINNAKLYLDIEKVRFGDKFDFIEEINEACKELEIPSMILQPLFENAIKHGVYESLEKIVIKLICEPQKEFLKITVENNFDPESVPRKGEGIGIKNIQNRLKIIYNHDNLINIERQKNIFRVNIYIPR
ncbi:MAG: GHKL domain-containing protein [Ignavibacteria bacterium]|nr:GHKL domain-containing protein [Ignavibacteria bacterium]